jgi:molybdate transport system ATP-binding protein
LLSDPQILILDEFCAGLDAFSRRALLDFTETLAHNGIQLICSTHRRDEITPSLNHILLLDEGRATPLKRSDWEEKHNHKLRGISQRPAFPPSRLPAKKPQEAFLLRAHHANVIIDEKRILHDINWEMKPGEHWAILGANGSGKSTFLKMLLGEIWPARGGHVHRFGKEGFEGLWKIKEKIGFVSHEFQAKYHEALSAREVVYSGYFHSVGLIDRVTRAQQKRVEELLSWLEISHLGERPFQGLSTGEARKILLARALVNRPQILLLDEPFDGLDEASRDFLTARFEELITQGTHFIFVSHHEADFPLFLTHEMLIESGTIKRVSHR